MSEEAVAESSKAATGELHASESLTAMAKALGVKPPETDAISPKETPPESPVSPVFIEEKTGQQKAELEGQKLVDKYSVVIQKHAEEAYANALYRAKNEEGFLDRLVHSPDPLEKRIAGKILERNADSFGADSIESYLLLRAKAQAGDDKAAQDRVELSHKIETIVREHAEQKWEIWKDRNAVKGDLASLADGIHGEYPNLPYGDILALAKGRMGNTVPPPQKPGASVATGAHPAPAVDTDVNPILRRKLRLTAEGERFADAYFGSL